MSAAGTGSYWAAPKAHSKATPSTKGPMVMLASCSAMARSRSFTPSTTTLPPPPAPPAASAPAPEAAAPAPAPAAGGILVPKNLLLNLEVVNEVSTKTANPDDFFKLRLAKDLVLDDKVVIPAGTPAVGQVIDSQAPGAFGVPGKLLVAIRFLELGDQKIPLRLYKASEGEDRTSLGTAIGLAAGPFVALVRGGHVVLAPGQILVAKIAKDTSVVPPVPALPIAPKSNPNPNPEKGAQP